MKGVVKKLLFLKNVVEKIVKLSVVLEEILFVLELLKL